MPDLQSPIPGLRLRLLAPEDKPAMVALLGTVLAALPNKRWYFDTEDEEFNSWLRNGEAYGFFCEDGLCAYGVLIPFRSRGDEHSYAVVLGDEKENTFDFTDVVVHPDWRRHGIHSALISLFTEMAEAQHGKAIYCTVDPLNVPSRASFEKGGFQAVTERMAYDGRPRVYYRKRLNRREPNQ